MNESEALRWIVRQWQMLNEKDEISGVGGMLWEFHKNGLFEIAAAAEQKTQSPNDRLQWVMERRLAEADRNNCSHLILN